MTRELDLEPLPPPVPLYTPQQLAEVALPAKKPHPGRAVQNGFIRYLSVSQVTKFDPADESGCPRRWAFQYMWGKKEPRTVKQEKGEEYARQGEQYLKTGDMVLSPVLRAGLHLLPRVGPDLEVEKRFGDIIAAVKLRDALIIARQVMDTARVRELEAEILRVGGLTVRGIPFDGAPDVRHFRNEYIDEDGVLRREDPGLIVCESIDHKTTTRIKDHVSRNGKLYKGNAKTSEQIANTVQMVGYFIDAFQKYPNLTHGRLSHIYYQTENGYSAVKRTSLVPAEALVRRWSRVETVVGEMEQVVSVARDPKEVPFNTRACRSYNRDCPHMSYCERPARSFRDILELPAGGLQSNVADLFSMAAQPTAGESNMSTVDLFGMVQGANGVPAVPPTIPVPVAPPIPVMSEAERAAAIEAEKARLMASRVQHPGNLGADGYTPGQPCNGHGYYASSNGQGFVMVEPGHSCPACAKAPNLHPAAVNPPDRPQHDPAQAAAPLLPQAITQMPDPTMRAMAEAHAAGTVQREAAQAAQEAASQPKKTSGKCPMGGQLMPIGPVELRTRKTKCSECGKPMNIPDKAINQECNAITVPGHLIPKVESAPAPAAPTPPVVPAAPPPAAAAPQVPVVAPQVPIAPPVPTPTPPPIAASVATAVAQTSMPAATVTTPVAPTSPAVPQVPVAPVAPEAPPVLAQAGAATSPRYTLYVDINFEKGGEPTSLEPWYLDIVHSIEQKYGLADIRMAPVTHDLGYGKWKPYLAMAVRANLPPPGEYSIRGSAMNEIVQEVVAALVPFCEKVRRGGVR